MMLYAFYICKKYHDQMSNNFTIEIQTSAWAGKTHKHLDPYAANSARPPANRAEHFVLSRNYSIAKTVTQNIFKISA